MAHEISPKMEPQPASADVYFGCRPEKIELIDGVLFGNIEESTKRSVRCARRGDTAMGREKASRALRCRHAGEDVALTKGEPAR